MKQKTKFASKLICLLFYFIFFKANQLNAQSFGVIDMRCDSNIAFTSLIQIPSGGFYAVGAFSTNYSLGDSTGASLYKLDSDMKIIWEKHYGGSKEDFFSGVKYYRNGKLLINGFTSSIDGDLINTNWPLGYRNYWVTIIDTNGNLLHSVTYGYGSSGGIEDIDFTKDGDVYIAGASVAKYGDFAGLNNQFLTYNVFVGRLDSQLNKKAFRVFQGSQGEEDVSMCVVNNNKIVLSITTGSYDSDFAVNSPVPSSWNVMFGIDSNLNTNWQKRYGCGIHIEVSMLFDSVTNTIYSLSTTQCKTDNCQDANYSYLNEYGNLYTWIKKMDTAGNLLWSRIYGGFNTNINKGPSVSPYNCLLSDGFLWVLNQATGTDSRELGSDSARLWLIKLDTATGKMISKQRFGNKDVDAIGIYNPLIKSSKDNYYFTPVIADNTFYYLNPLNCIVDTLPSDKVTYHVFKIIEWPDKLQEIDKTLDGVKIYPNPANTEIIIELENNDTENYLGIYTLEGKLLLNQKLQNKRNKINVYNLPTGNYLTIIQNKDKKITKTITIKK
jgi:Secretion system C-terminal sorting domain